MRRRALFLSSVLLLVLTTKAQADSVLPVVEVGLGASSGFSSSMSMPAENTLPLGNSWLRGLMYLDEIGAFRSACPSTDLGGGASSSSSLERPPSPQMGLVQRDDGSASEMFEWLSPENLASLPSPRKLAVFHPPRS